MLSQTGALCLSPPLILLPLPLPLPLLFPGAEGMVFAPGGDFSWISQAKVVSMELHDYFSGYFGLGEVRAPHACVRCHNWKATACQTILYDSAKHTRHSESCLHLALLLLAV